MKTLLSLFDYSGQWSDPFRKKGWNVIQWDIKLAEFMDIMLLDSAETVLDLFENVDGIISAPPCTHFTKSGAQYWKIKDEDGRTWEMLQLVHQVQRLADLFRPTDPEFDGVFFWAIENPVGRLQKLVPELGDPFYFHPYEYAGHTNPTEEELIQLDAIRLKEGIDVSEEENELVLKISAYKKQTGLWGEFNREMVKKPIEPAKTSKQGTFTQRYGGKSDRTKELRSNTPAGFAEAFCEANHDFQCFLDEDGNFFDYE